MLVCKRLNTEADMKIQLPSIKSDIKEICKNVNSTTLFTKIFLNTFFHKNGH